MITYLHRWRVPAVVYSLEQEVNVGIDDPLENVVVSQNLEVIAVEDVHLDALLIIQDMVPLVLETEEWMRV